MNEHRNVKNVQSDDSHRLWLPHLPWVMKQTWNELLFAYYPIKLKKLQKLVPDVLALDSFEGMCWIGIVLFHVSGLRLRGLPPIPGTDRFPQVNVRTYVTLADKPGVYFFSLDTANWLAMKMAKVFFRLPYMYADMMIRQNGHEVNFENRRRSGDYVKLVCNYRSISEPYQPVKSSFDKWMAERYCLYTINNRGVPLRCNIMHTPWLLQKAEAEFSENTMLSMQGIQVESDKPILHFSKEKEVRVWPLVHM